MPLDITLSKIRTFIDICDAATSQEILLSSTIETGEAIGIKSNYYHYIPHFAAHDYNAEKTIHATHEPDLEWSLHYKKLYRFVRDPLQEYCFKSGKAIWSKDLIKREGFQAKKSIEYLEGVTKALGHGVLVPVFGANRSRGMQYLTTEDQDAKPTVMDLFLLQQMCFHFHARYCELRKFEPPRVSLTKREKDVLQLLPFGRSNREIAEILKISPNTVNEYVRKILLKFNAPDRMTASLRAFTMDLIE